MTTENTLKHDLRIARQELADIQKRNLELCETAKRLDGQLCDVLKVFDEAHVPNQMNGPDGKPHFLTAAERVRFMALRFVGAVEHIQRLEKKLKILGKSVAGVLVGPDGRPLSS